MELILEPTRPARHLSEEILEAYALGRTPEAELEPIETHLLICPECQDALAEADVYVTAMKGALEEGAQEKQPERPWLAWWEQIKHPRPVQVLSAALAAAILTIAVTQVQHAGSATLVTLRSERGTTNGAVVSAGVPMDLRVEADHITLGPEHRLQIVDAVGKQAWIGAMPAGVAHVQGALPAGKYWVRLYDGQQSLLQEYGLELK